MNLVIQKEKSIKTKFFKALADPIRLEIIDFLANGEKCVCEIVEQLAIIQPLVSRHLRILRESGIVTDRRDGTKKMYKLSSIKIKELIDLLDHNLLEELSQKILQEAF